jgi:small subunit ribosomal protein S14|uniref:Small ribosomal subunit protein uS14c n=1 Tax=Partenskyella glossopodia TaxID=552666 RepID=A0A140JZR0_9EUKA|nr:30S ribosomal protein S14 [Partenskyella glossopodia]BAU62587.1 30S ribosomal protein S14 [Partenskyella glossopodia]
MAKKGMIERERKRQNLVNKYNFIRKSLKIKINMSNSFSSTLQLYRDLELLPRNSMKIRLRNRCFITGKSRGFYRDFGLSRNMLRYMGHECLIPGLIKSSW